MHYQKIIDLVDLFETSVADGRELTTVIGSDVSKFCDEFLYDTKKWTDKFSEKLNHDILKKTGRGK